MSFTRSCKTGKTFIFDSTKTLEISSRSSHICLSFYFSEHLEVAGGTGASVQGFLVEIVAIN